MHRRTFLMGLVGLGAAVAGAAMTLDAAEAAMPVAPAPLPDPMATTAEVQPGRDVLPAVENAQFRFRRRRRVFVRRRRRAFFRRRRRF